MDSPAEHVNALFAEQVAAFAADLDQRSQERFPAMLEQALAAQGIERQQMSPREAAVADAVMQACLQVIGEVVGLAMRRSADLLATALDTARVGFPPDTGL